MSFNYIDLETKEVLIYFQFAKNLNEHWGMHTESLENIKFDLIRRN